MEKFGKTLLFAIFIMMLMVGTKGALRVIDPYTRKVSPSLADFLQAI